MGALASSKNGNDIMTLLEGYQLCAATEGKSGKTIEIVTRSVTYFTRFLTAHGINTDAALVGRAEIRAFIHYLQQKKCFSGHPVTPPLERGLSSHSISCYLRSLRSFFSWLTSEEIIEPNPFAKVKIPRPERKVIPTFSDGQIEQLLAVIDTSRALGYRDAVMILTMLDTGIRVSELCGIKLGDVWLNEGVFKVLGKGNKERLIPVGRRLKKLLWHYISRFRPGSSLPGADFLFLTHDGRPLDKDRVDKIMKAYGRKTGLSGVRCSPHTLRHTAAVSFLRNGGDVFTLQRLLGHSSLEMTRRYCEMADVDVKRTHLVASPLDNLKLGRSARLPVGRGR